MFRRTFGMTEEEKQKYIEVMGKTILYLAMNKHEFDIAKELGMQPWQVAHNIDELLYELQRSLGWKRYIKALRKK